MKNNNEIFTQHHRERFAQYLSDVKKGTAKIAVGAVLRHEIQRHGIRHGVGESLGNGRRGAVCWKFREAGYGEAVPEVVFWNLRDSRSTPVPSSQKRVALVSGFSKNQVKLFLEGILSPRAVMETAIAGKEYQKLMVFD